MSTSILYVGTADLRVITPEDAAKYKVELEETVNFTPSQPEEVSEDLAKVLLKHPHWAGQFQEAEDWEERSEYDLPEDDEVNEGEASDQLSFPEDGPIPDGSAIVNSGPLKPAKGRAAADQAKGDEASTSGKPEEPSK